MGSPGKYLKNEREAKGISIEEVAKSTNINRKFLLAIENDENGQLPSHTVTIGFLRAYSTCIGINSDKVVEKYNDHLAKLQFAAENVSEQSNDSAFDATNVKFLLSIAGSVLAIIVLVFAIIKITSTNVPVPVEEVTMDISAHSTAPVETPPLPTPSPVKRKKETPPSTSISKKGTLKPHETRAAVNAPTEKRTGKVPPPPPTVSPLKKAGDVLAKKLRLKISANERAWINVIIDGEVTKDVILPENQALTWEAKESFLFSTGNIRGVALRLNNMPVSLPEKKGRVLKNFLITADSQKTVGIIKNQ